MSLRLRFVAAFGYVLVLVLLAIEIPFALSVKHRVEAEVRAQAANQAHLIAASASGDINRPAALQRLAERAGGDLDGRVIVVDSRARLVADSAGPERRLTSYEGRPEIESVLADGRPVQGTRRSDTLDQDLLYTAVPVVSAGSRVGAVRVTQSAAPIGERVRRDVLVLAGIGVGALLFGLALAWLLGGSLAGPLRRLAGAARSVEAGRLETRADVAGSPEQREVAAAFNQMTERLGQVLAAQREFVANASHQLRTPLTGLRLRLESASLAASDPELARELDAAEREVERLSKLLTGLLALAREGGDTAEPRPVDLAAAARSAEERWAAQAERAGRALRVAALPPVAALASEEDVATALDNLVENALAYSPPGSPVALEWGREGADAYVAVVDEGPGLPAGEEEHVFERFRRGSTSRGGPGGTGLGLAIVRALAVRWGGSASVRSRPGGGLWAEIRFPAGELPAAAGGTRSRAEVHA